MKKRLICLALAALMMLAVCACGAEPAKTDPTPEANPGQQTSTATPDPASVVPDAPLEMSDETLRVAIGGEPSSLLPGFTNSTTPMISVVPCLYSQIFRYVNGEVKNDLATDYTWLDDLHLQITIQSGVIAPDGTEMKASDALYSLRFMSTNSEASNYVTIDFDKCEVKDDYTYVIALKETNPFLIELMSRPTCGVVLDESTVESLGGIEAAAYSGNISNGKYLVDEWSQGQFIRLIRNENYWNIENDPSYYKYIEFSFVADAATRAMAVQSGDQDIAYGVSYAQIASTSADKNVYGLEREEIAAKCLVFNCSREPLNNEKVREALCLLVNIDSVIQLETGGHAEKCDSFVFGTSKYYARTSVADRPRDVDKAKQLLAEAGYPNGLDLTINCRDANIQLAELIQACFLEGGVNLKIISLDGAATQSVYASGDYDMYVNGCYMNSPANSLDWFDGRIPTTVARGGCQYTVGGDEYYALIDRCRYTIDEAERIAAWAELQEYAASHSLFLGLYTSRVYSVCSVKIGYVENCEGANIYLPATRPAV